MRVPTVRSDAFMRDALRAWGPSVYNLAVLQTGSCADADDVYQDVFLRLATSTVDFADAEHLKAWLLRVTVNRCRDLARSAWVRRTVALDPDAPPAGPAVPSAADEALSTLAAHELWSAVARLSPKLREVVYLHYAQDLDSSAIAELLHTRPSTVRTRLQRAREQLRTMLGGSYHG